MQSVRRTTLAERAVHGAVETGAGCFRASQFSAALPSPLPGDFAHYLQRASFDKALAWLEANHS